MKNKITIGIIATAVVLFLFTQSSADTDFTEESQLIQTAQKALESTVRIASQNLSHGSGFYISENEVITNYHVIRHGNFSITTYDKRICTAKLKYQEDGIDLALLVTDCKGTPLEVTESYVIGQTVLSVGNPDDYKFIVTKGIVSGEIWQNVLFDAPITQGSSGSPLVDIKGKVIGVTRAVGKRIPIGYAITGKEVNRFLERAR